MIYLFTGENSYTRHQEVQRLMEDFTGQVEKYEGSELTKSMMADITQGMSLFSEKKLIIIDQLSDNKLLWNDIESWCMAMDEEILCILIEPKPDKRTKSYKYLQTIATVKDFTMFTSRDESRVEQWLIRYAETRELVLQKSAAREIIRRLGYDQWALVNEIERLSGFSTISLETVQQYTPGTEDENIFALLEVSLRGDKQRIVEILRSIKTLNDSYITFGLLSSQVFTLSALVLNEGKSIQQVAKDIGQKEFALNKLRSLGSTTTRAKLRAIIDSLVVADKRMKTTDAPWQAIEHFLLHIADIK